MPTTTLTGTISTYQLVGNDIALTVLGTITNGPDTYGGIEVLGANATITNAGSINGSDIYNGFGISGRTHPFTVVNLGRISGTTQGIYSNPGASVTNQAGGEIVATGSGSGFGVYITARYTNPPIIGSAVVVNAGLISAYTNALFLSVPASVTNQSGGTISAANYGINLRQGGSLTNQSGGTITARSRSVIFSGLEAAMTITNSGLLSSQNGNGVWFTGGGILNNQTGGRVFGAVEGVKGSSRAATVVNAGTIHGAPAIDLAAGSAVTNQSGGVIEGNVLLNPGAANVLAIQGGSTITGIADGGNTIGATVTSTLALASGATAGTLSGLGSHYIDFSQVAVEAGALWTLASAPVDSGTTIRVQGTLTNAGSLGTGVTLQGAGQLTNSATGTIVAGTGVTGAASTIANAGTILGTGTAGTGVVLTNAGVLSNTGLIQASGTGASGVVLQAGGSVTNAVGGGIAGGRYGIDIHGGAGSVTNAGSIGGGVTLASGFANRLEIHTGSTIVGTATGGNTIGSTAVSTLALGSDASTGTLGGLGSHYIGFAQVAVMSGAQWVFAPSYIFTAGMTLSNAGTIAGDVSFAAGAGNRLDIYTGSTITGTADGGNTIGSTTVSTLELRSGASVGTLSGLGSHYINFGRVAIDSGARWAFDASDTFAAVATLANAGTITSDVSFAAGASHVLAIGVGSTITGTADGGNTIGSSIVSTLELTSGASTGTLSGFGSTYQHFGNVIVDAGAHWVLGGTNTIRAGMTLAVNNAVLTNSGTLVNDGAIVLDPSTLFVGDLLGSGSVTIQTGSTLDVTGTIANTGTIVFAGPNAYLHLHSPNDALGQVLGFTGGDVIDLEGVDPAGVVFGSDLLQFNSRYLRLATADSSQVRITASTDGTAVTVLCFLPDTLIETPSGRCKVQDLRVGDLVATFGGAHRPVAWIGTGAVLATRGKRGPATPVILRKGALAKNVPSQDLRVTKGHSFLIDGVLIPAEFLVNHRSILWDDRAQEVTLYHVELETHDILIANGAPAESYRDDGNRWLFHNANSGWDQPAKEPCAPVLTGGPIVDAIWRRLLDRAGPRPGVPLTEDADLHLRVDGRRVDGVRQTGGAMRFAITGPASDIRIVSRSGSPAEQGLARDPRVLGVAIQMLRCWKGARLRLMAAADAALRDGFHGYEAEQDFRWTDGDAAVPGDLIEGLAGQWELEVAVAATARYPLLAEAA